MKKILIILITILVSINVDAGKNVVEKVIDNDGVCYWYASSSSVIMIPIEKKTQFIAIDSAIGSFVNPDLQHFYDSIWIHCNLYGYDEYHKITKINEFVITGHVGGTCPNQFISNDDYVEKEIIDFIEKKHGYVEFIYNKSYGSSFEFQFPCLKNDNTEIRIENKIKTAKTQRKHSR